jgi:hypothetical protein
MTKQNTSQKKVTIKEAVAQLTAEQSAEAMALPYPVPIRIVPNSGLYTYSVLTPIGPQPIHQPLTPAPITTPEPQIEEASELMESSAISPVIPLIPYGELRLDVDGYYPEMKASGQISGRKISPAYWIANVIRTRANTYEGGVWYKEGNVVLLPFTHVKIEVARTLLTPQSAKVTFSGGGAHDTVQTFKYKSRYFHPVNFEFDTAEGVSPVLTYNTCSHPNHPAPLPCEDLSIATVYRRAGFDVSISGAGDVVPIAEAHADAKWSDAEMHDAMQVHWSKFANAPQWALWTFFASLHEMGTSLGGIMFDDIGPNHRQGTSLFLDSFIKTPPPGDPAPAAWVNRMIFWTACHEMGHSFNLAHSWQKNLGVQWIPLTNEPLARSFMNYPYNVPGGSSAFFTDFEFRFSDGELLFMRHAPFRFVQQGNADWFDHHGFQQANISQEPKFSLSIECAGKPEELEFLEPVVVHLTLKNISDQPQLVDEKLLASTDRMTIIIKKRGKPAREFVSYAQRCWKENSIVLKPGAEMKDSVFLVGRNGWDLAEPGYYMVQASVDVIGEDIVSDPVTVRVAPPKGYEEEHVAQDFFSDEVGRVLNFDGSRLLVDANNYLRNLVERLPNSRAAIHAKVALASPLISAYKEIEFSAETHTLKLGKAKHEEANKLLAVLVEDPETSASTLGQVDYDYYCDRFKSLLGEVRKVARKR